MYELRSITGWHSVASNEITARTLAEHYVRGWLMVGVEQEVTITHHGEVYCVVNAESVRVHHDTP